MPATSDSLVDFGRVTSDYRRHRAGLPLEFFHRITGDGLVQPQMRLLDVGSGTGDLARRFAAAGCAVTAVDAASEMVAITQEISREEGLAITALQGQAENLPFAGEMFDVVTAAQCWHWFDRTKAAQESWRVLVPRGLLMIVHFDWVPLPGNVVAASEALILKHNSRWGYAGGTGIHEQWFADLAANAFVELKSFSFDVNVPYSREGWMGRIRASAGVGASMDADTLRQFEEEHRVLLARDFPQRALEVPHRLWCVYGRKGDAAKANG